MVGVILLSALIIAGILYGHKNRERINAMRAPKSSWKQGHKLRINVKPVQQKPVRRRTPARGLTDNDLDDLDDAFGDDPSSYD